MWLFVSIAPVERDRQDRQLRGIDLSSLPPSISPPFHFLLFRSITSLQMPVPSLLLLTFLFSSSIADFIQCPNNLMPKDLGIVGVWKNSHSTEYVISDEDLSISNYSLLNEGSKTVLLPRLTGQCPLGLCIQQFDIHLKDGGGTSYSENVFGGNDVNLNAHSILCAKQEGDCGADSPIYVHSTIINGTRVNGYTLNGATRLEGFERQSTPLCYAWTRRSSVISNEKNTSKYCIEMQSVENGKIVYSSESSSGLHSVGTSATISCSSSFVSTGHSLAVCTREGWYPTNGLGPCLRMTVSAISTSFLEGECAMLNDTPNGRLIYSTLPKSSRFGSGSVVSLICDLGYAPAGETSSTCIDGTWTKTLSECYNFASFKCLPPLPITNGRMSYFFPSRTPFSHGSHIQLECAEGFVLEGRDLMTCTSQGWNPPVLGVCRQSAVQCPILSTVADGTISYTLPLTPTAQGSTALLACAEGTVPHGSLSTVCLNGQWTNRLGTCGSSVVAPMSTTGTHCLPLPHVLNGRISYSLEENNGGYPPSTTATPSCITGYNLYGSQTATCLPTGQWTSSSVGNCGPGLPNECPEFNGTNMIINYNLPTGRQGFRRESTIATLSCDGNRAVEGNVVSTCVAGKWSPPFGSCPVSSIGGNALSDSVAPSSTTPSTVLNDPLDGDGDLVGESSRVVGSGTSSSTCHSPIIPLGGTLSYSTIPNIGLYNQGTFVSLNCPGSTPIGSSQSQCVNGQFIPPIGRCAQPGEAGYGSGSFGGTVNGIPNRGFPSTNSPIGINGQSNGFQTTNPSLGGPMGSLGAPCVLSPTGSPSSGSFPSGSVLTLQCPLGSSVTGAVTASCINGQWSQMGSCQSVDSLSSFCLPFGSLRTAQIEDGELRYSNEVQGKVAIGTVVRVNCSLGYRVEGEKAAVCTTQGWRPETIGRCLSDIGEQTAGVSSCNGAPLVLNGQIQYSSNYPYPIGSYARLLCNPGFSLYGTATLTCITGIWSPQSFGQCVGGGGVLPPQTTQPWTTTTQPWTTTSQWTTQPWTTTTPTPLISRNCLVPPLTPLQGSLRYSSGNIVGPWNEGVIVALICTNGYHVTGVGAASCKSGSFQPPQLGSCQSSIGASRLPCSAPLTPLNGQFNFSTTPLPTGGYPDGSMTALFCQQSNIPYISTCSNAVWYPSIPVSCVGQQRDSPPFTEDSSSSCPSLRAPPYGEITFSLPSQPETPTEYPSSTRAVLVCTGGTRVEGNRESTCYNRVFTPPLGLCI